MDFRTLRYVVAISEYQNITKAAEALYVGQPTLSKFLISLEKELDLKLFRRLGHRYLPTYAGERYVARAKQILQLGEDLDAEMSDILKRDVGVLRVAFAPMRGAYLLPMILPVFQARYPNVKITVLEGNSETNDQRLLNGQADLAFYSKPAETNSQIEYTTLAQEELLLCTGKNHPIGNAARHISGSPYPYLDLGLLQNERVLLLMPSQRTRQITDSVLHAGRVQLSDTLVMSNMQAIMGLVSSGYGVSFLFDCHLQHRVDPRPIECYRFGEKETLCDFVAANRKGSYLPGYAQDFIEIVKSVL
ncbi:MAG: LysR family transcriptional regulator [Oscillospiraceae bacterium]|nr:LysR family transcriptional regulator [Oscillospiraceae bacterium]